MEDLCLSLNQMSNNLKQITASKTDLEKEIKEKEIAQTALAKKNEELQKISTYKTQFIDTVSHELRTPLSTINEAVSFLVDKIPGELNDKQKEILQMTQQNIKRLGNIINDLLDTSKIEAGKIELKKTNIDIVSLLKTIIKNWEMPTKEKKLTISSKLPETKIMIFLDERRIIQVFDNLFSNSLKFTPEGGNISIELKDFEDHIEIIFSDTGAGILKENLSKVFQKFEQFSRQDGPGPHGTGLGLSICKSLINLHKGEITVESEEGKGTKFLITLPKEKTQ